MEATMTAESAAHREAEPVAPPIETMLLEEPTGADLKSKVTEAWQDFARALADVTAGLDPGAQLDLTLDPTASGTGDAVYAVQIATIEGRQLAASAVSNAHLPAGYRLDRSAVGHLVALGWSPPGVVEGSQDSF